MRKIRFFVPRLLLSLIMIYFFGNSTSKSIIETAVPMVSAPMPFEWPTNMTLSKIAKNPVPLNVRKATFLSTTKRPGMGPTIIANTEDGKYAYVGFHLSEIIAKVRLADLTVEEVADLSQYFPLQCYRIALDVSEKKLFVHSASWRKLLVLDTQTLSVIHTIDNIDSSGMIRSQDGRLMVWDGGNTVKFVNTESYAVTEFTDPKIGFLHIQESPSDPSNWYVATQLGPGAPWTIGIYNYVMKAWIHTETIPLQGTTPGIWDFKVLPNEKKLYIAVVGGWYEQENHAYGWLYSVDMLGWQVKTIPIDGGAVSLETSPDSQRLYVAPGYADPNDTNNIHIFDARLDTLIGPIHLGRSKYDWAFREIRDMQLDVVNPNRLYGVSNDANSFFCVDLNNLSLSSAIIFNEEDLQPHSFSNRPTHSSGYVLLHQSAYGFEFDLDLATIKSVVRFPEIRKDSGAYDVANTNDGRLLIAQGEQILEVDGTDMSLIASHPLPSNIPSIWRFILSKDQSRLYAITHDSITGRPNVFIALNTSNYQTQTKMMLLGGAFGFKPFELPDGSKLYALGGEDFGTTVIHVIRTDDFTIQKTIIFDEPGLRGISGGPYFPYAYDASSHILYVGATYVILGINTDTDEITKIIYLEDIARAIGFEPQQFVYVNAIGLVYQPQENFLYVVHLDRSFVSIYDLTNKRFLPQVIPLKGFFPNYVFANDDVSKIFVVNTRSDSISVIDVNKKAEERVIYLHDYLNEPYLSILSPNGREKWLYGTSHNITWNSIVWIANVKIEYSANNGFSWNTIIASTPNTDSYSWTVPDTPSAQCLVRISYAAAGLPSDTSDSVFSIVTLPPTIRLNKNILNFGAKTSESVSSDQSVAITNSGEATLAWTATPSASWITVTPTSGIGGGIVNIGVTPTGLASGNYTRTVSFSDPNATNSPQIVNVNLTVYEADGALPPFGSFDTPIDGTSGITGAIPVTGWALDDIGIEMVKIYRDSVAGEETEDIIYIGDAMFVEGARPDVEQAYPDYPLNYQAGWGYMLLTNFLPGQGNGTYKIHAYATDLDGHTVSLGTKTITCDNANAIKPFGAIDTPTQGGTVTGSFFNSGWALTPMPNNIPIDGSTISVWVDGVRLGNPAYNQYRNDIAMLFPDYANTDGAVGAYYLDTTTYTNGVHTIAWSVKDNVGNSDGIGSRFFTIANTGGSLQTKLLNQDMEPSRSISIKTILNFPVNFESIEYRKGYRKNIEPEIARADEYGLAVIEIREVERIELDLGEGSQYRGYQIVGEELRPLPVGSSLNIETGVFYWQPGPGFIGEYDLVFIKVDEFGMQRKINVKIKVRPKFGGNHIDLLKDAKVKEEVSDSDIPSR